MITKPSPGYSALGSSCIDQLTGPSLIVQDFLLHLVQNHYRASGPHYHDLAEQELIYNYKYIHPG
jgi:hypothetical protein